MPESSAAASSSRWGESTNTPIAVISGGSFAMIFAASFGVDRKSTRLNSSHSQISYAVFCLKKKKASPRTLHLVPSTHFTYRHRSPLFPSSDRHHPHLPTHPPLLRSTVHHPAPLRRADLASH